MLDSMNLPDETQVFVLVSSSKKNSESGVFCCRLQIHESIKAWLKLPTRFFHYFTQKIANFSQTVCFELFNTTFNTINITGLLTGCGRKINNCAGS